MEITRLELPLALHRVAPAVRQLLQQEGIPCVETPTAAPARFVLYDRRRNGFPTLRPGQTAIDLAALAEESPQICWDEWTRQEMTYRRWRIPATEAKTAAPLWAQERVSAVDRGELRRTLLPRLRRKLEALGGVWLRVASVPAPYRSAFCLRLDYDACERDDLQRTWQALRGHEEACSHFINAAAFATQPAALSHLTDVDVGSHGWWHHSYRDPLENRDNIARGIEALRRHGLDPQGFAAPHGRHDATLPSILRSLDVTHSSEFGCGYDDFPLLLADDQVVQIPVHPVCLGIVLDAAQRQTPAIAPAVAAERLLLHWERVAAQKFAAREWLMFYGHPDGRLGRYPQVLQGLFDTIASFPAVWQTNYSTLAQWWQARCQVRFSVRREGQVLQIDVLERPRRWNLSLEHVTAAGISCLQLDRDHVRWSPDDDPREPLPAVELPRSEPAETPGTWRERVLREVDWEHDTPWAEISTRTWRGRVKRSLRKVRDAWRRPTSLTQST